MQFFEQIQKTIKHGLNYDILIKNSRVSNSIYGYKLASSQLYACLTKLTISSLFVGIFEFYFLYTQIGNQCLPDKCNLAKTKIKKKILSNAP